MRVLARLWREPAFKGLLWALWLGLFSWPFWTGSEDYRAIGFLFPYHFACWLALIAALALGARAAAQPQGPEGEDGHGL